MPTLAELANRNNAELVPNIVFQAFQDDEFTSRIPAYGYTGPGVENIREVTPGDVQGLAVGGTITAKAGSTTARTTYRAVTTIGDIELNGLLMAESGSNGVDMLAQEIDSKSREIGKYTATQIATGTGSSPSWNSLPSLTDGSQYTTASAGRALTLSGLNELLNLVKPGMADAIVMPQIGINLVRLIWYNLGGTVPEMAINMPNGQTRTVVKHNGVPILGSDYLSVAETANGAALTGGALFSVYAIKFDRGDARSGLSLIYPANGPSAGVQIFTAGIKDLKDEEITRLWTYWNLANFNIQSLARHASIDPTTTPTP